mmetsp:Transcript_36965/g.71088  ORF Transcript_36965/g.71088 Transcript_36965/m.71088 type:complete len:94 (+) Transcript_36965:414-695(+)
MFDNVAKVTGAEAEIQRMKDCSHAAQRMVGVQMPTRVPHERTDSIADLHSPLIQCACEALGFQEMLSEGDLVIAARYFRDDQIIRLQESAAIH